MLFCFALLFFWNFRTGIRKVPEEQKTEVSGRKMDQRFYDMLEANPVIAAVKDEEGLEKCCGLEEIKVVFMM